MMGRTRRPPQFTALCFVALLLLDGLPAAQATRSGKNMRLDTFEGEESGWWWESSEEKAEEPSQNDGGEDVIGDDAADEAIWEKEQLEDPHKPMVKWSNLQRWSDRFRKFSGIGGREADKRYADAVRKVLPDAYIDESAQFVLCARVSSSAVQDEVEGMTLRCSPVMNMLASPGEQDAAGRLNLKDVWKGLRDLVENVKVPNINWSNDWTSSTWRTMTNWATGKKDRFIREQTVTDGWFGDYFEAEIKATSFSFLKESIHVAPDKVQKLLQFDYGAGGTKVDFISATQGGQKKWPGKYQPSMGSRYLLCFGHLSHPGTASVDPNNLDDHCTGFWNKDMTKSAIMGLGNSLSGDSYRDETLFNVRMEILYGVGDSDGLKSMFNIARSTPSAKSLGKTLAKLVRERIASEGIQVSAYAANAAGVRGPGANSLVQLDNAFLHVQDQRLEITPWVNIAPYSEGIWTLTLENGVLVEATAGGVAATGAAGGAVAVGGVMFPPALIIAAVIATFYIIKGLKKVIWEKYLTNKKLKKWRRLLADKNTGARISCFVNSTSLSKAPERGKPRCLPRA